MEACRPSSARSPRGAARMPNGPRQLAAVRQQAAQPDRPRRRGMASVLDVYRRRTQRRLPMRPRTAPPPPGSRRRAGGEETRARGPSPRAAHRLRAGKPGAAGGSRSAARPPRGARRPVHPPAQEEPAPHGDSAATLETPVRRSGPGPQEADETGKSGAHRTRIGVRSSQVWAGRALGARKAPVVGRLVGRRRRPRRNPLQRTSRARLRKSQPRRRGPAGAARRFRCRSRQAHGPVHRAIRSKDRRGRAPTAGPDRSGCRRRKARLRRRHERGVRAVGGRFETKGFRICTTEPRVRRAARGRLSRRQLRARRGARRIQTAGALPPVGETRTQMVTRTGQKRAGVPAARARERGSDRPAGRCQSDGRGFGLN